MDTKRRIINGYISTLRETGEPPASVYAFCKKLKIDEKAFFTEFSSFDSVESVYWSDLVDRVITAVESGEEWQAFTARQRMLAFLFAFFEESLNHRSLFLSRFLKIGPMARPVFLRSFEARFKKFAEETIAHGKATGEIAERGRLSLLYPEALYVHFRVVIDFNLKDESEGCERTDAFIEKTVAVTFDVIRTQALDSAFDLARFLIPRPLGKAAV